MAGQKVLTVYLAGSLGRESWQEILTGSLGGFFGRLGTRESRVLFVESKLVSIDFNFIFKRSQLHYVKEISRK